MTFQTIARGYRNFALLFLNTVLIGAVIGSIVFLVVRFKTSKLPENPIEKYGITALEGGFAGHTTNEIATLIKEAWERPFIYEAYTQFSESPCTGRFVNVSQAGFRLVQNAGPWPPEPHRINVFVFGGSTTFGYGVTDIETIPSVLQQKLRASSSKQVCVYNFGRGFYYSTQERILFSNLLVAGIIPELAIFIDGLNEFYRFQDTPQFSSYFMGLINQNFLESRGVEQIRVSDIVRKSSSPMAPRDEATARKICERYLRNTELTEAMARAKGVKTLFVWQPVSVYKFDRKFHPFSNTSLDFFAGLGYAQMAQWRKSDGPAAQVLWLADMQENAREQLYCDSVHYTAKMCGQIAEEIARFIRAQSLMK